MSMISTKNFIAPFTNKVHIISILLCAIAFAALRLSGGAISLKKQIPRNSALVKPADIEPVKPRSSVLDMLNSDAAEEDEITAPAREMPVIPEPRRRPPAESGAKRSGGLADIEKELGL